MKVLIRKSMGFGTMFPTRSQVHIQKIWGFLWSSWLLFCKLGKIIGAILGIIAILALGYLVLVVFMAA